MSVAVILCGLVCSCLTLNLGTDLVRDSGVGQGINVLALRQDHSEACSITCLSAVAQYWKVAKTPREIEADLGDLPAGGYTLAQLRDWARANGLQAYVFRGTLADIRTHTQRGRPVIITYQANEGNHSVVVTGLSEKGNLLVMDPQRGRAVAFRRDRVLERWDAVGRPLLLIAPATAVP